MMIDI